MKKILIILGLGMCSLIVVAQDYAEARAVPYLFEHFTKGVVLLKSGATESALFNYNTEDQSVAFQQDGKVMTLTALETVDTIYFFNKKFIAGADDRIYEVITVSPVAALLASYTGKLKPRIAVTDQSGTSHKDAGETSNTMSSIYVLRPYKGDYTVSIQKNFWLIKHKQIFKAVSLKEFNKVFPHHETEISKYSVDNGIKLNNELDLTKLTEFCNTLP